MSNLRPDTQPRECSSGNHDPLEILEARSAEVGGLTIRRALPLRKRRMIGPWCFLDHFGPDSFHHREEGMWVGPHPHTGLQTVTWLLEGEVLHRDSIGSEMLIRPGQLNIMTSGRGISHTEESPRDDGGVHGVQFWVALPDADRHRDPDFEHHPTLPVVDRDAYTATLLAGVGMGEDSPATVYSKMVGMDIRVHEAGVHTLALDESFEHGVVLMVGNLRIDGQRVAMGRLGYLGPHRSELVFETDGPVHFILVGGEPFGESVLLWWNFVARTPEEIAKARKEWHDGQRFGEVVGWDGPRLNAPELGRIKAPR